MAHMRPYAEEAYEMKLRLLAGVADVPDVVAWADEVFARSPEYDDDLANICLATKASWKDVLTLLNKVACGEDEWDRDGSVVTPRRYVVAMESLFACRQCARQATIWQVHARFYGENVLHDRALTIRAYLNRAIDETARELRELIPKMYPGANLPERGLADVFALVVGVTCDPIEGKQVELLTFRSCPSCGSEDVRLGGHGRPRIVRAMIPEVRHRHWARLTEEQKRTAIHERVSAQRHLLDEATVQKLEAAGYLR